MDIECIRRTNRAGYKAGALKEVQPVIVKLTVLEMWTHVPQKATALCGMQGMELLTSFDHVAVFDADFKPDPDFLVSCLKIAFTAPHRAHHKLLFPCSVIWFHI